MVAGRVPKLVDGSCRTKGVCALREFRGAFHDCDGDATCCVTAGSAHAVAISATAIITATRLKMILWVRAASEWSRCPRRRTGLVLAI
jgi:hypothetical protein